MTTRIGINGVGRIGRNLWRIIHASAPDLAVVATNDTADLASVAHLLRYDSIRGRFPGTVETGDGAVMVDGARVPVLHEPLPARIDWAAHGVDLVIESTGEFIRGPGARGHLRGGAPIVVISTATPVADVCLMMGINEHVFDPRRHRVLSNSCCSTYCMAAILHPLLHGFGVETGSATIAYSHGSRPGPLLDDSFPHLRMARANAMSIVPGGIPGVRHALDRVLPALAGRIATTAMRVPVRAVSAASLSLRLSRPATVDEINGCLHASAASLQKGYLEVSEEPLVSSDLLGSPASCVVDAGLTTVLEDLAQVVGWYDNEWGYAQRLVDLARFVTAHR